MKTQEGRGGGGVQKVCALPNPAAGRAAAPGPFSLMFKEAARLRVTCIAVPGAPHSPTRLLWKDYSLQVPSRNF